MLIKKKRPLNQVKTFKSLKVRLFVTEQEKSTAETAFLRGIAKLDNRLILLLDLDKVLDKHFQITVPAMMS